MHDMLIKDVGQTALPNQRIVPRPQNLIIRSSMSKNSRSNPNPNPNFFICSFFWHKFFWTYHCSTNHGWRIKGVLSTIASFTSSSSTGCHGATKKGGTSSYTPADSSIASENMSEDSGVSLLAEFLERWVSWVFHSTASYECSTHWCECSTWKIRHGSNHNCQMRVLALPQVWTLPKWPHVLMDGNTENSD